MRERLQVALILLFIAALAWLSCAWIIPAVAPHMRLPLAHRIGSITALVALAIGLYCLNQCEKAGDRHAE